MTLRAATALALSLAAIACAAQHEASAEPTTRRGTAREASAAALFGETLGGDRVELGGPGPVRLVELWATWCAPCGPATEIARPVLRRHPGVVAWSLAIDERDAVARHVASTSPLGAVLVYPGGPAAASKRGLDQLPMFVALDARGRVAGTVVGLRPNLGAILERLLNQAEGVSARVE